MEAGPDPRVTGPANCSHDANTTASTLLVQSWTAIDSSSPPYTCAQLESWIRLLGEREFDEDISQNAAAWARVLFHEQKLKSGRQWIRIQSPDFFRDALQVPPLYAQMFWEAIVRDDFVVSDARTPIVDCTPVIQARGAPAPSSSFDSTAMRDLLMQNAQLNEEMRLALCDSIRDITRSTRRPIGTPAPLEGAKPTVTKFIKYVEDIAMKYSTHNCNTSMALNLWLKNLRMSDSEREALMNADEKLRLWEVTHALVDKAILDTIPADVHSSKDGLKLLNEVFRKVINPEFILYSERLYTFFNASVAVPAANIAQLQSEFGEWLLTMTEVRYLDKVTAQELWNATYKYFAHFKMIQDHLRDKWTPNGTTQQFDTLIASIPDAIMMTQKALGVTPTEDGFQVQKGRNRTKNQGQGNPKPGNNPSNKGLDRRSSAPDVLQQPQSQQPPRKPLSQAERIQNGICPNYPRNCRFGDVCKFQHVDSKGQNGKPDGQNVRSVSVQDPQDTAVFDQKLDQLLNAALTRAVQKLTGVIPPIASKGIVAIDHATSAKAFSSRSSLPVSHACVRTCISEFADTPEPVVRHVGVNVKSVLSSLLSVLSENSTRGVCPNACVSPVSSPNVVYQPVSPSVTYAQVVKSCLPTVCGTVESVRRGVVRSKSNPRLLMQKVAPIKRAPTYQQTMAKALVQERVSIGLNPNPAKGPLIDTCSSINITARNEKHLLNNLRPCGSVVIEGIAGPVASPTLQGDRTVGPIAIVGSILVDSAKESVVCPQTLARNGVTGIFQKLDSPSGMVLVYPTHTVECVPDGTLGYRLPVSGTSIKEKHLEVAVAEMGCAQIVRDRLKKEFVDHQLAGHHPKPPLGRCSYMGTGACDQQKVSTVKSKAPTEWVTMRDNEFGVSADFIEMPTKSAAGNAVALNLVTSDGLGYVEALPNRQAPTVQASIERGLAYFRRLSGGTKNIVFRFHTDRDKGFLGAVSKYARTLEVPWLQTTTKGYDSNANARAESRNGKLLTMAKTILLDATGARHTYESLWDVALVHANDLINHLPEAGSESPVVRAGGAKFDIRTAIEVFGCRVYAYKNVIRKNGKVDITSQECIWVGRGRSTLGHHGLLPVIWDPALADWRFGAYFESDSVSIHHGVFPLRTRASQADSTLALEQFVDQFSPQAIPREVYEIQSIVDHRHVGDDIEYKIRWRGYGKRDDQWVLDTDVWNYGGSEAIVRYMTKIKQAGYGVSSDPNNSLQTTPNPKLGSSKFQRLEARLLQNVSFSVRMSAASPTFDPDLSVVMEAMRKKKLPGTVGAWLAAYKAEMTEVSTRRFTDVSPEEKARVLAHETVIRLMMRYEPKSGGRCKCRLVARGDMEPKEWFDTTDSPTALPSSIKTLVACGNNYGFLDDDEISIGDISIAFLKANSFSPEDRARWVAFRADRVAELKLWRLTGGLYGQRDCGLRWYKTLVEWLLSVGFVQSLNDPCIFFHPKSKLRIGVHVDDIIVRGQRQASKEFWQSVDRKFGVKSWGFVEEGQPQTFLSMRIQCSKTNGIRWYSIDQSEDIAQLLVDEEVTGTVPVTAPMPDRDELTSDPTPVTPKQHKWVRRVVGALSYYANTTRFDISYEVNRVAQYLQAPTLGTIKALKRILAYLAGTVDRVLRVARVGTTDWQIYSDSDHAGDRQVNQTRSVTGMLVMCNGMPVHWRSNKQPISSISSTAAEIYALAETVRDANLRYWIAEEMDIIVKWPMEVFVDNSSGISFQQSTNPNTKLRGIYDMREAWVQELRNKFKVKAVKVHTDKNLADMFTKCLAATVRRRLFDEIEAIAIQITKVKS